MTRLSLGWLRLTGCSGCQLSLLDAEELLAAAAPLVEIVDFPLVASHPDAHRPLDAALVEGCVSTPDELEALMRLRLRTPALVAVGACAVSGGIPALAGDRRGERVREIYGDDSPCTSFPPLPVRSFVRVDLSLPGCPPEAQELYEALAALARGALPDTPTPPVCFECRLRERPCLLFETTPRQPCLGPVTRGGCAARCPVLGIPCEGCRGSIASPREGQLEILLKGAGLNAGEIRACRTRFERGGA